MMKMCIVEKNIEWFFAILDSVNGAPQQVLNHNSMCWNFNTDDVASSPRRLSPA